MYRLRNKWSQLLYLLRRGVRYTPDQLCARGDHDPVVERTPMIDPSPTRTRCRNCRKIKRYTGEWL